jgi:hypothetical protein
MSFEDREEITQQVAVIWACFEKVYFEKAALGTVEMRDAVAYLLTTFLHDINRIADGVGESDDDACNEEA